MLNARENDLSFFIFGQACSGPLPPSAYLCHPAVVSRTVARTLTVYKPQSILDPIPNGSYLWTRCGAGAAPKQTTD